MQQEPGGPRPTPLEQSIARQLMNYRHAFHAGNSADVLKHLALVRVIEAMKRKAKPFRYIDTHAGRGLYRLNSKQALRSGEADAGIKSLVEAASHPPLVPRGISAGTWLGELVAPFFEVLNAVALGPATSADSEPLPLPLVYPGSSEIARRLTRADDRLVVNELHDEDGAALRRLMARDKRVRVLSLDGYVVAKSALPPVERRGVLLIDPPFEEAGEFHRLEQALSAAAKRFASGVTLIWYPIKAGGQSGAFLKRIEKSGLRRLLCVECLLRHRDQPGGLNGSGLLIHNPPYQLVEELDALLGWLLSCLGGAAGKGGEITWLVGE